MKRYGAFILIACILIVSFPAIPLFASAPTGLVNGKDYYVMNSTTEKYLSPVSSTNSNNVRVVGRDRGTQIYSRWTVNIIESTETNSQTNYIRLTNANGNAGRNLYVSGTNLVIYNIIDEQSSFIVQRIESGNHQGQYTIRYGNQYVAMDWSRNVYLTTSSSDNIYWTFMAVEKGKANLISFLYMYDGDKCYNSSVNDDIFTGIFYALGYDATPHSNTTVDIAFQLLTHGDIFIYRGHGGPGRLSFQTTDNYVTGKILADSYIDAPFPSYTVYSISDCSPNELAIQRCVLYIGCNTGVTQERGGRAFNLLDSTFAKGAHFVLGTTDTTYSNQTNPWLEYFLDDVNNNSTIYSRIAYANRELGWVDLPVDPEDESLGTHSVFGLPCVTVGDGNQYLN